MKINFLQNNLPQNEFPKLLINVKKTLKFFHYFQFSPTKYLFRKHKKWKVCHSPPKFNILSHSFRLNNFIQLKKESKSFASTHESDLKNINWIWIKTLDKELIWKRMCEWKYWQVQNWTLIDLIVNLGVSGIDSVVRF